MSDGDIADWSDADADWRQWFSGNVDMNGEIMGRLRTAFERRMWGEPALDEELKEAFLALWDRATDRHLGRLEL